MASSATVIVNGPTTSGILINSMDRYPNGVPPAASSNQTTATDITYSVPGLANMSTCQVGNNSFSSGWWNQVNQSAISAAFYTNIINLVDYTAGKTYLITIPETNYTISQILTNFLAKYVMASGFGGSFIGNPSSIIISVNGGSAPYYDPVSAPTSQWWQWYDNRSSNRNSLGWSRVTTAPDGTDISKRRQLFDLLALAAHVPSVAITSTSPAQESSGYTTCTFTQGNVFQVYPPIRYVDIISPQLTPFANDINSCTTASSNYVTRMFNFALGNILNTLRVLKVAPGSTTLQLKMVDDQGNPIPTNFSVPAPYQGALIAGVGIQNTTTSNLTFSGISNANVTFPTGTQVNILSVSAAPSGWNPGVYQVQSSTSNTVVIPYTCASVSQISNAASTFTIIPVWLTSKAGNQNGPEYYFTLTGISRTTLA